MKVVVNLKKKKGLNQWIKNINNNGKKKENTEQEMI